MNKNIRIIPRLDIKGPNLVKGIHLEGLRVLGRPEDFARYYYKMGADELIYMDTVASLYGRNSLNDIIVRTANEIFIPLTVGGGIRTIEDIRCVLRSGADKVSINTAAINNPGIIEEAARKFGSSTIVVSIEASRQEKGNYLAYTNNGREYTGVDVLNWAKRVEELGAGEILLTSIDKEGTGSGFDIELTRMVSDIVNIPVIASGGAGKTGDVKAVIENGHADAVSIASMFHYDFIKERRDKLEFSSEEEGNIEFLKAGKTFSKIKTASLAQIKKFLLENNISCRYSAEQEILIS